MITEFLVYYEVDKNRNLSVEVFKGNDFLLNLPRVVCEDDSFSIEV
jgi:hypothetical protein